MAEQNKTGGGEAKIVELTTYEDELLGFVRKAEPIAGIYETSDSQNSSLSAIIENDLKKKKLSTRATNIERFDCQKAHLYAIQCLLEAKKIEDDDELKERLIKFHRNEIESTLAFLEDSSL